MINWPSVDRRGCCQLLRRPTTIQFLVLSVQLCEARGIVRTWSAGGGAILMRGLSLGGKLARCGSKRRHGNSNMSQGSS